MRGKKKVLSLRSHHRKGRWKKKKEKKKPLLSLLTYRLDPLDASACCSLRRLGCHAFALRHAAPGGRGVGGGGRRESSSSVGGGGGALCCRRRRRRSERVEHRRREPSHGSVSADATLFHRRGGSQRAVMGRRVAHPVEGGREQGRGRARARGGDGGGSEGIMVVVAIPGI